MLKKLILIGALSVITLSGAYALTKPAKQHIKAEATYLPAKTAKDKAALSETKGAKTVQDVINFINTELNLPEKITFVMGAEDGPLFDPALLEIWIPYSFIAEMKEYFAQDYDKDSDFTPEIAAQDVLFHTLFHELGHALIEVLELPVTGKEEDAVDTLATVMLIEMYDDGAEYALSAADAFGYENEEYGISAHDYAGEHSLDIQRYYNTLCLIYGSAPKEYKELAEDLEGDRAEMCVETYEVKANAWLTLLALYMVDK